MAGMKQGKRARKPIADDVPLEGAALKRKVRELAEVRRIYTVAEVRKQMSRVEDLMKEGAGDRQIHRLLTTANPKNGEVEFPGLTLKKVRQRVVAVSQIWQEELRDDRAGVITKRMAQIKRLHEMRRWALAGERGPNGAGWLRKPDGALAIRCEALIMKLEGTAKPLEIEVTSTQVSTAMMAVIQTMDEDTARELLAEAREEERLAREARRLLPSIVDMAPTDPAGSVEGRSS